MVAAINTCVVTGRVAGDSDACGDCDPCIHGATRVPDVVKRLLAEKDEWRDKYAHAMDAIDDSRRLTRELDLALNGDGAAQQASLCDVVSQVKDARWKLVRAEANN